MEKIRPPQTHSSMFGTLTISGPVYRRRPSGFSKAPRAANTQAHGQKERSWVAINWTGTGIDVVYIGVQGGTLTTTTTH